MLSLSFLAMALGVLGLPHLAFASGGVDDPNGAFQLEGNATTDPGICYEVTSTGPLLAPGFPNCPGGFTAVTFGSQTEDWDKIFAASTGSGTTAATAFSFSSDAFNSGSDNIFTGGSTKDISDFSQWLWKNGKPQGKDDLEHAYAAAYTRSSDQHVILVAGTDRFDNSGDSTVGFWFVQDQTVGSGVTGTCSGGGCAFGGKHTDGDLLVVSDFSTGGAISSITVYKWSAGSLVQVATGAECNILTGSANLCGIVNPVNVTAPWSFTDKHLGPTPNFETGEFLEVGLDLTNLFGSTPCISTFFAESRSSTTPNSTLSDFTKPASFPLCSITATKSCTGAAIDPSGTTVTWNFGGTITAQGGTLSNPSFQDNPNNCGYRSSNVPGNVCTDGSGNTVSNLVLNQPTATTLPPGPPGVSYSGSFQTNFVSSTFDNRAKAFGTTPEGDPLSGPANGASWLVNGSNGCAPTVSGCLQLSKTCTTSITGGNPLGIEVDISGSITNTANTAVNNITISDTPTATITSVTCGTGCSGSGNGSFTLSPGGTATYTGNYKESGSSIVCTPTSDGKSGRCTFTDTVTASGTAAIGGNPINSCTPPTTATCSLCPFGTCSTGP